jgi:hypothetical protein
MDIPLLTEREAIRAALGLATGVYTSAARSLSSKSLIAHASGRMASMDSLPGNDLIVTGVEDLRHQRQTIPALLVAIGAPKLRSLGLEVPENLPSTPEHRLYDLLSNSDPDSAHSKYNALIRRLVSFERAMACVKK